MTQDVLFERLPGRGGDVGIISLNRPAALNALNADMIQAMFTQLSQWAQDEAIKAVIIESMPGRAFCAGGDLRTTYQSMLSNSLEAVNFFRNEYELNKLIFHYPKPYIALLNGITMGGGVGISIHGSHRVATDNLLFAMPETGIGFFPDVGGTYFLPRLKNKLGYYLGLTGARIKADDCVFLGIVQVKVPEQQLITIKQTIAASSFSENASESVTAILNTFAIKETTSSLLAENEFLEYCFSGETIEEIISRTKKNSSDTLCQQAWDALSQKSPMSLKISLRAMQLAEKLAFDACMRQELVLASHFARSHDFKEGIRAVIIDKDQAPRWNPATLSEVTTQMIDRYFESSVLST